MSPSIDNNTALSYITITLQIAKELSMRSIVHITRRLFCDLNTKNRQFLRKLRKYEKDVYIHQKAADIDQKKMADFVTDTPPEKIAYEMANRTDYDKQLKQFIQKFNTKHKNRVTLLDFSQYITDLGDLKDKPLRKQDIELIKQFQKRKVDQRVSDISQEIHLKNRKTIASRSLNEIQRQLLGADNLIQRSKQQNMIDENQNQENQEQQSTLKLVEESETRLDGQLTQGPFIINDDFVIILLNVRSNTKVTTLNRINSYKTLMFMGNGNGIISYAKGRGYSPVQSLAKTIDMLKKNLIAIPRDSRCTLPMAIKKRFQDYTLYLRPKPGFNAHGHPIMAFLITLAGIDHCAFNVSHSDKNVYNVLKVFYKAITTNTTPQELAEREGFKVYRHQFIRPLTYVRTHGSLTGQAKIRSYGMSPRKQKSPFDN